MKLEFTDIPKKSILYLNNVANNEKKNNELFSVENDIELKYCVTIYANEDGRFWLETSKFFMFREEERYSDPLNMFFYEVFIA